MNLAFGDLATLVAPVQVREFIGTGWQFANAVALAVRARRPVAVESATNAVQGFAQSRVALPGEEARALDVAARRYLTSQTETDPVDNTAISGRVASSRPCSSGRRAERSDESLKL
jgi:hypothetical protein